MDLWNSAGIPVSPNGGVRERELEMPSEFTFIGKKTLAAGQSFEWNSKDTRNDEDGATSTGFRPRFARFPAKPIDD